MISSCWGVLQTNGRTDGQTNEQTFVIVESLSRLKNTEKRSSPFTSVKENRKFQNDFITETFNILCGKFFDSFKINPMSMYKTFPN